MISIDDRVGSRELHPHIPRPTPTTLTRLQYADVCWLGEGDGGQPVSVGVERKRIGDLVNSIDSGRLSGGQLHGLLCAYDYVYVLVEGLWRPSPETGVLQVSRKRGWQDLEYGNQRWMARRIHNYLATLELVCGVRVWRTATIEESGRWLGDCYHWWQKAWVEHRAHLQWHTPHWYSQPRGCLVRLQKPSLVERVAREITGMGQRRAEALGRKYGSVLELVMAGEGELREVEGVGKKLAKTIVGELRGDVLV